MKWNAERINNVIEKKISGEWGQDAADNSGVFVLRTTNFQNNGIINYDNVVVRDIDPKKVASKKLVSGDIIIEKSGGSPNQPVGRVVFFEGNQSGVFLCNNFTSILRPGKKVVPKFLMYCLFYLYRKGVVLKYQNKTTGIINLKLDRYLDEEIPLPPLDEQKRIAAILDKADQLRNARRQAIAECDEFLKSTFIEMFGHIVSNTMNWPIRQLHTFSSSRLGKMLDKKKQTGKHAMPYLRNANVQWKHFVLDDLYKMDFSLKEQQEFSLQYGDVLICEGGEVGKCAIWKENIQNCFFQKALHRVRLDNSIMLPEFFIEVMHEYAENNGFKDYMTSATIPHLTGVKLKKLEIPIPPLPLQEKFAEIVKQTEAMKEWMKASERELDDNFNSLMQRAFKGEL
ncbi:MAG: restriction endonuclease subunit S [Victivallales bacterium]|nr:restriction endonuclease subunit S [Victivallales bacterium]